jgi:tryptophan synthase alpha chain
MSAVDEAFRTLRQQGRKAFIPFVTAGDPDLDFTLALVGELAGRGVTLCEIGVPYSDPIADGSVVQASYTRALNKHIKLASIFQSLRPLSHRLSVPLVTMVSYAIVWRQGLERFVAQAQDAGVAGAIVPDLLVEEAQELAQICRRRDFSLIQLVTPTTPRDRAVQIAQRSSGFLYYVSITGITGERQSLPAQLVDNVSWLREQTDLPVCIGFGISAPEHVRQLKEVADGVIVGSAIMRRVAHVEQRGRDAVLREVGQFVDQMLAAL